jgi:hypothetical protein
VTTAGGRDIGLAGDPEETNRGVAESCHHLWGAPTMDLGAILIEGHIADPMGAIFDLPMGRTRLRSRAASARVRAADWLAPLPPKRRV